MCCQKNPPKFFINKAALFSPIKGGCQAQFKGKLSALIDISISTPTAASKQCIEKSTETIFVFRQAHPWFS